MQREMVEQLAREVKQNIIDMDRIMLEEKKIIKELEEFELMAGKKIYLEEKQYKLQKRISCIIEKNEKQLVIARHLKSCILECLDQKIDSKSRSLFFYWEEKQSDFVTEYRMFLLVKDDMKSWEDVVGNSKEVLKEEVRKLLRKKGYVIDSFFEGDFVTWIGVYARPADKPTYLDPMTEKDAELQEKYRDENGFKRDFGEWFEWEIKKGHLVE